jgi:hypothetical protein
VQKSGALTPPSGRYGKSGIDGTARRSSSVGFGGAAAAWFQLLLRRWTWDVWDCSTADRSPGLHGVTSRVIKDAVDTPHRHSIAEPTETIDDSQNEKYCAAHAAYRGDAKHDQSCHRTQGQKPRLVSLAWFARPPFRAASTIRSERSYPPAQPAAFNPQFYDRSTFAASCPPDATSRTSGNQEKARSEKGAPLEVRGESEWAALILADSQIISAS